MTPSTVPGAPTIGTATAAGPTSATVTWTAPTNGGSAITGYSVRVLDSSNAQVGALRPAASTATSLALTGLTTGKAYHFTVTATNAVGTSVASANSAAVTLIVPGTPGIGLAVAGTAGGAITATANWTAPAANAGPAITAYQVVAEQLSATGTVLATTTSANQPATARTLSMTLPVAGNYRFSVRAINIVGNGALSATSNTVAGR
jgi:predicted phage tail protein